MIPARFEILRPSRRAADGEVTLLSGLLDAIAARLQFNERFSELAWTARSLAAADRCSVIVTSVDDDSFRLVATESFGEPTGLTPGVAGGLSGTAVSRVLATGRPFLRPDVGSLAPYPASQRFVRAEGQESCCLLPLRVGGELVAVLALLSRQRDAFTESDTEALAGFARSVATALADVAR